MEKYQVIVADPPWFYNNRKTGGERKNKTKFGGGAQKHYSLMRLADIIALRQKLDAWAAQNSILFLWATFPTLPDALRVMEGWGFRYATIGFPWVKPVRAFYNVAQELLKIGDLPEKSRTYGGMILAARKFKGRRLFKPGPGYYTASNAEAVLCGVRGSMKPFETMIDSVIFEPVREHSRKPEIVQDRIDRMYPHVRRLEMFARRARPGWEVWGNQVEKK